MFTRCPHCLETQAITSEALRSGRGMARCSRCASMFDALATLADTQTQAVADAPPAAAPWSESKIRSPGLWRVGLLLGAAVLAAQALYFEGERILQHAKVRPALEKICGLLHCRLPDYKNLAELTVLHNSFSQLPNQHYAFKLVLDNEGAFPMRYPNVGLTLLAYDGQPFAHRLFLPADYLAGEKSKQRLDANSAVEISLEIAAPKMKVGGFHFDLSY
ncbi:MAG: zinc-ribbon and DUF3426 domain-containing protein [Gammaproteobacteria bacterium]